MPLAWGQRVPLPITLHWDFIPGLEGTTAKAEAAPPWPPLHGPELDFSALRIYIVRKGARATLKTERQAEHPTSCEDHMREGKWLGCLPLGLVRRKPYPCPIAQDGSRLGPDTWAVATGSAWPPAVCPATPSLPPIRGRRFLQGKLLYRDG